MKCRISYTVELDDGFLRAIVHYYGGGDAVSGRKATRTEIISWFRMHGDGLEADLYLEHRECCWGEPERDTFNPRDVAILGGDPSL